MYQEQLPEVQTRFAQDRFATENGAQIIEIGDHMAVCRIDITDRHRNALGAVMGGALFTLADFAFAVAANWQGQATVSLSSNMTFLGGAKGKQLLAKAVRVKDGRTICYYQVTVTDELGTLLAEGSTSGYHV